MAGQFRSAPAPSHRSQHEGMVFAVTLKPITGPGVPSLNVC
jgi:hypothetical protein